VKSIQISCKCCGEKITLSTKALEQMLKATEEQEEREPLSTGEHATVDMFSKLFGFK